MTITYPLSVEVNLTLEKKGGFTRLDVFKSIYEAYKQIYEEEEKSIGDPGMYDNLYNRKKSEGKYGIWGHYLGELVTKSVTYNLKEKNLTNLSVLKHISPMLKLHISHKEQNHSAPFPVLL